MFLGIESIFGMFQRFIHCVIFHWVWYDLRDNRKTCDCWLELERWKSQCIQNNRWLVLVPSTSASEAATGCAAGANALRWSSLPIWKLQTHENSHWTQSDKSHSEYGPNFLNWSISIATSCLILWAQFSFLLIFHSLTFDYRLLFHKMHARQMRWIGHSRLGEKFKERNHRWQNARNQSERWYLVSTSLSVSDVLECCFALVALWATYKCKCNRLVNLCLFDMTIHLSGTGQRKTVNCAADYLIVIFASSLCVLTWW